MDDRLLELYIREVQLQCRFALFAADQLDALLGLLQRAPNTAHNEPIFFYLHAILAHAGNVSKLFWPVQRCRPQRERLRAALKMHQTSPLYSRGVRDSLEHYDEELEDWYDNSPHRNLIDMSIGPPDVIAGPIKYHRYFDPYNSVLTVLGETVDLRVLVQELRRVEQIAGEALAR